MGTQEVPEPEPAGWTETRKLATDTLPTHPREAAIAVSALETSKARTRRFIL
jgi:hypothetical protein